MISALRILTALIFASGVAACGSTQLKEYEPKQEVPHEWPVEGGGAFGDFTWVTNDGRWVRKSDLEAGYVPQQAVSNEDPPPQYSPEYQEYLDWKQWQEFKRFQDWKRKQQSTTQ